MITRRGLLAIGPVLYAADMLGPNGSWGPVVWDHKAAKTIPLSVAFSGTITGKLSVAIDVVKNA